MPRAGANAPLVSLLVLINRSSEEAMRNLALIDGLQAQIDTPGIVAAGAGSLARIDAGGSVGPTADAANAHRRQVQQQCVLMAKAHLDEVFQLTQSLARMCGAAGA